MFRSAEPIWLSTEYRPDEYVQAMDALFLQALPASTTLRIAADSDYTVYISGQRPAHLLL